MADAKPPVTKLLREWASGNEKAHEELFAIIYDQLRTLARYHIRNEAPGHTLSATALVHEAYLRLADAEIPWNDRAHFFAISATVMRRILVDHAKARTRLKRGGNAPAVSLEEALVVSAEPDPRIIFVDEALNKLAEMDQRKAQIVELSFFSGLTLQEITQVVGGSASTVHRELAFAKAWI